jgi:hypothetical protein
VALQQAHDGGLADHRVRRGELDATLLVGVHVAGLRADESLVDLDLTGQLAAVFALQRKAQTRQHEPRGLLGHFQGARQLVAADAVLAVDDEPQRREPLLQRERGILEHGPDLERELRPRVSFVAFPHARRFEVLHASRAAARALNRAARPPKRDDSVVAVLVVREEQNRLLKGARGGHE